MAHNVTRIRNVLKTALGSAFKAYYDGDPDLIPESRLPAIVVSKLGDDASPGTQLQDDVTERIVIKVILNKKTDWGGQSDEVDLTEVKLRDYIEKRTDSGAWDPQSIRGVLRSQLSDGVMQIDRQTELQLGMLQRPKNLITHEGHLIVTIRSVVTSTSP